MLRFRHYLEEKVLSIGFNPAHEKHREQYRQQMHDMLHKAYSSIGGYGGVGSGTPEESRAIHNDITHSNIKAVRRGDKISAVQLYKPQHGRKTIALATDGSTQGKKDMLKTGSEDHEHKRAWAEVSGAPEKIFKKLGYPTVPAKHAEKLLGKQVNVHPDGEHYTRNIGGHPHTKTIIGHPKG